VVRAVVAVAVGLVALGLAAAFALPRLVDAESVRGTVTEAARNALGRDLSYRELDFGLLPPSIRVMEPVVAGERESSPPLLEAKEIGLRVSVLPLFWGTVLIDSLVVDGATVRLTRGADGLELPRPPETEAPAADDAPAEDAGGVSLAVRDLRLQGSTLVLIDRSVAPVVEWELRDLEVETSGSLLGGTLAIEGTGTLASGGALTLDGTVGGDGGLDLRLGIDGLALAPLDPYLEDLALAGTADGSVAVAGPAEAPERIAVDLRGAQMALTQGENRLTGKLRIESELASVSTAASGPFEIDVTDADVTVGTTLTKAAGIPGRVAGRLASGSDGGLVIEDLAITLHHLAATGRAPSVSPFAIELDAEPFEMEGWDRVLPALAGGALSGSLALDKFAYDTGAQKLGGAIELVDFSREMEGAAPVVLRGTVRADGGRITSEGLTVTSGGESIPVDLELTDLFGSARYRVAVVTEEAEANRTLTAFLAKPDTLYGPLSLDSALAGPLSGDFLASTKGKLGFKIVDGKLVGVSLLESVFERFGAAGGVAVALGQAVGGKDLQRFYGDAFEELSGTLDVADGIARTSDLVFRYQGYDVRLRGKIGLADLSLQMSGELTLREEIDTALAEELGVKGHTPRQRVIPLASLTGTLDAPKVRLGSDTVARFAAAYAADAYVGKAREEIEKELGEGAGELVDQGLEVLQGILGAGRRAPKPPPEEPPAPPAETPETSEPPSPSP
jgi:hypothetical protein